MNNVEAAEKGYERLRAVADEHGIEVVVVIVSTFGANARELRGRNEGMYVAALIGRVPDDEWAVGVGYAVRDQAEFMAAAKALVDG